MVLGELMWEKGTPGRGLQLMGSRDGFCTSRLMMIHATAALNRAGLARPGLRQTLQMFVVNQLEAAGEWKCRGEIMDSQVMNRDSWFYQALLNLHLPKIFPIIVMIGPTSRSIHDSPNIQEV